MRRLAWFVALTYLFAWVWWVPMALSGVVVEPGQGWPTHLPGLLAPALAALIVTAATEGSTGLASLWSRITRWRVAWWWYAIIAATAALALLPMLVSDAAVGDVAIYSGAPSAGLLAIAYVLLVNGFGEEIGWRGYLADGLLDRFSRGVTALIVWVVWATWHLPMFWVVANFRDLGAGGTVGWVVGIGCGSVFLTWMYQSASRSILVVALWHTAFNFATATKASAGAAAALASTLVIAASVVILCFRSSWRGPRPQGT